MRRRLNYFVVVLTLGIFASGCGKKSDHTHGAHEEVEHAKSAERSEHSEHDGHAEHREHGEHGEGEEESGVTFEAGRGLQLTPEMIKALNLTVVEAAERPLSPTLELTAQIFAVTPKVLASARVPVAQADAIEQVQFKGAKLLRVERSMATATRFVDTLFALEQPVSPVVGEFVTLSAVPSPRSVLAVPRSAVLDAATGTFVYVVKGEAYLRSVVKLGVRSADDVEITEGLSVGDRVVISPVDQLWLAELRLTKGGGHSH